MNRATFLRGVAGVVAGAVLAPIATAESFSPPRLYGDGYHDDAPAVQYAINQAAKNGGTVRFSSGTFRLGRTIHLRSNVSLVGGNFKADKNASPVFYGNKVSNVSMIGTYIQHFGQGIGIAV